MGLLGRGQPLQCQLLRVGGKGLRGGGWVFPAPKVFIISKQPGKGRVSEQCRQEGDDQPEGAVLGG